ncbi:MAG: DUF1849 family protein [Pseudomonadota bacterium]
MPSALRTPSTPLYAALVAGVAGLTLLAASSVEARPAGTPIAHPADAFDSHEALYRMTLEGKGEDVGIDDLTGVLGLKWERSCEGFTFTEWMTSYFWDFDGNEYWSDIRSTTWESRDRQSYGFSVTDRTNGVVSKSLSGQARWPETPPGEPRIGLIDFNEANEPSIELPAGTAFPSLHLGLLVEAAKAGKASLRRPVFDAVGETQVYDSVATIKPLPDGHASGIKRLDTERAWYMLVSYFLPEAKEPQPNYEVGFVVYENGIVDDLVATYDDELAVRADLTSLDYLPAGGGC